MGNQINHKVVEKFTQWAKSMKALKGAFDVAHERTVVSQVELDVTATGQNVKTEFFRGRAAGENILTRSEETIGSEANSQSQLFAVAGIGIQWVDERNYTSATAGDDDLIQRCLDQAQVEVKSGNRVVDRFHLAAEGRIRPVDLADARNVDEYRMFIGAFPVKASEQFTVDLVSPSGIITAGNNPLIACHLKVLTAEL